MVPFFAKKTLMGFALILHRATAFYNTVDLSTQNWTLASPQHNITVPGKVPSHAHIDLYDAHVIDDPLSELQEFDQRWIAYSNWTYSCDIDGLNKSQNVETHLIFDGLDTYASVEFCGQHVANADNQFRQWIFNISELLQSCNQSRHSLEINFGPIPNISEAIANQLGQETWPGGIEGVYEFPNRQFVRKEQSDFGWDWGPAFLPVGVWQPAYVAQLDGLGSVYVSNSDFDIYRKGQLNNLPPPQNTDWVFNASIDVVGTVPEDAIMSCQIFDMDSNEQISSDNLSNIHNIGNTITGIATLDASKYELWWPNGLGAQKLYNIRVEIVSDGKTIATVEKRMGFRTIVLNMEPISQEQLSQGIINGSNWHFEVNGHEFYAKGSNFVPPDPFWPRVTYENIQSIFTDVVDSHQNMLRVWSSGAYAPDFMYDLADEMGLLLWCEFEFSVALYPASPDFLENVRQEAVYQVRRTNHHPSMAVWAGGNEMEKDELPAVKSGHPDEYDKYLNEYFELFLNTLLPAVYENSHSISYMPCSTNNGYLELNFSLPIPFVDRLYNTTPGYLYGDSDLYDYNPEEAFNISTYVVNRFANEFGFESMPSIETWSEAIPEDQLYFNSTMTVLRNHHYPARNLSTSVNANHLKGMGEMTQAVQLWYPQPNKQNPQANFSAWCHATQIFQADYYHTKVQYYRAGSGLPQRQMGALYWQLNDVWQAPTWSGREYDGRWKVMFYAMKDIFQPVIIAPVYNDTTGIMTLYAVSDLWSDVQAEASWGWIGYDGNPVENMSQVSTSNQFTIGAINSTVLTTVNVTDLLSNGSIPEDNAFLVANISATGTYPNSKETKTFSHSNFFTPAPLSKARLVDPGLKISRVGNDFEVIAEKGVSAFTWIAPHLDDSGVIVVFDDNGFLLRKGESRRIGYRIISGSSSGWEDRITVSSIWNQTQP